MLSQGIQVQYRKNYCLDNNDWLSNIETAEICWQFLGQIMTIFTKIIPIAYEVNTTRYNCQNKRTVVRTTEPSLDAVLLVKFFQLD